MSAYPEDARPRRSGWALGRWVPIATPPTVPWGPSGPAPDPSPLPGAGSGPSDLLGGTGPVGLGPVGGRGPVGPGSAGAGAARSDPAGASGSGAAAVRGPVQELVLDLGRWAVSSAVTGVQDGLAALVARRDPVRRHARRVRRERRRLGAESAVAGGLGVLAATAGVAPGWSVAEIGFGGTAAVVGLAAVGSARRLRDLRQHPPRPHDRPRPQRPPRDCPARRPLDRLDERERALAGLLTHLGEAGAEPRQVAADAAATLRELGARTTAVDRARRGASPESAAGLDAAVAVLVERLDAGVAAYGALVVAAADAVAASATLQAGDPVLLLRLTEATDSLAGLAQGMREVAS